MEKYQKSIAIGFLVVFLVYCAFLVRNYRNKMSDQKYEEFDDQGEEEEY
jgi:hypothetical protein